jgi:uncharacterized phiE125 gp8 family phage protein
MKPIPGRIELVSKTTGAIVTLDEIKAFLLLVGTTIDDTLLTTMEVAARDKVENYLRRPLLPQTSRIWFDNGVFGTVRFPFGKLNSINNVTTYASDGSPTVSDTSEYIVDVTNDQQGRVYFTQGQYGYRDINDVSIEFMNGYATEAGVPQLIKDGILSLISYWFENREMYGSNALTSGVKNKLNPYRIVRF